MTTPRFTAEHAESAERKSFAPANSALSAVEHPLVFAASRFALHSSRLGLLGLALLAACSLAEDVTPPPGFEDAEIGPQIVATPTTEVVIPADTGLGYPAAPPSIARGAAIYAQNCARCHGSGGAGDGPMASQIEFPLPDFTRPDLALNTTPAKWFDAITNGSIERLMPPWKDSLAEEQRWHLVAYLYSLSAAPEMLEAGKVIYAADCAGCHGEAGKGDGPKAEGALPDFAGQQFMAAKADADFLAAIGSETAIPNHTFTNYTGDQLRAAVAFVRAFSFDAAPPEIAKGTVTGKLTNGTAGAAVPSGLEVTLHLFDNFQETGAVAAATGSDGAFEFSGVELLPDRALIVSAEHDGVTYASDVGVVTEGQTTFDLPLTVFEAASDPAALSIERMHVVFEFNEGYVQVGELFVIANNGDRAFAPAAPGGPTTAFPLPQGYSDLGFQDGSLGDRYLQTADGFADTAPVLPGSNSRQILVSFKLPYIDSLAFSQTLPYPSAAVNILLPDSGVALSGSGVTDEGTQDIQGSGFRSYNVSAVEAGSVIAFELKGKPSFAASAAGGQLSTAFDSRSLLIGGLSLALVASVIAYWWVQRTPAPAAAAPKGRAARDPAARAEELLREIAELDEGFEAGEYPEADYRKEREKLKAELRRLMQPAGRK